MKATKDSFKLQEIIKTSQNNKKLNHQDQLLNLEVFEGKQELKSSI